MFIMAMIWPAAVAVRPESVPVDDQTYTEAVMEDALRESDATIARLSNLSAAAGTTRAKVGAAAERLKIVSAEKTEVIRRASART